MATRAQRWRLALFGLACAALLAAAIGFSGGEQSPRRTAASPSAAQPAARAARSLRVTLGAAAHRFLGAFFRYEVGELGPAVRRALRANATPGFASELLSAPPRRPPGAPPPALPGRLAIAVASIEPPRALISGSASRGGATDEQFSFLFEARHGAWLASGPGE